MQGVPERMVKTLEREKKIRTPLWIYPSAVALIEELYVRDNCKSKSEFIEKAVRFYCGYLKTEGGNEYLPRVLISTMRGMLDCFEDRQAALLFKLAVEVCMMLHVTAATNEIDGDTLSRLRGRCVQEVKALRGAISFDRTVRFQKED